MMHETPFDHQPRRYSAAHEDAVIDEMRAMRGKHPSGMSANAGGENVDRSALRAPFDEWGDGPGLSSHAIGTPEYRREIIRKALRGHVIAWTVASLPLLWAGITAVLAQ